MTYLPPRTQDIAVVRNNTMLYSNLGAIVTEVDSSVLVEGAYAPDRLVRQFNMRVTPQTTEIKTSDVIQYGNRSYQIESIVGNQDTGRIEAIAVSLEDA